MNVQDITFHAYERAAERLGISRPAFAEWVKATSRQWIAVNAGYLRDRGVTVSQLTKLFITPWTAGEALALCCSEDNAVKTIIPFKDDRFAFRDAKDLRAMALAKAAKDRYAEIDGLLEKLVRARLSGPCVEEALTAYVDGLIDIEDLGAILRTHPRYRKQMLSACMGALKAA